MILREREFRASGINCGRTEGGQFAPSNDCASGGGGGAAVASRPKDESWKRESGSKEWTRSDLKKASPIKGGDTLESLTIRNVPSFRKAQSDHGLNLDEIVTLGGGAIRGADVWLASYSAGDISVASQIPIDPEDPDLGSVESSVEIGKEKGSSYIEYGTFFPESDFDLDPSTQNRIASVMMERMLDSMSMASDAGFDHARMLAIGSAPDKDKGYRLWPQFGFDAKLPQELFAKIPKEILDKTPRVAKSSKLSRKSLTLQELISTRDGERWWDANGETLDMKLSFGDSSSLGMKRFEAMKAKLPRLKERNKRRSYFDWLDDVEFRAGLDCGRTSGGQFAADNDCAGGGSGSGGASEPPARDRDDGWMKDAPEEMIDLTGERLKESPPLSIPGSEGLARVRIKNPKDTAAALKAFQVTLDDLATLVGGAREGGEFEFKSAYNYDQDTLSAYSVMPLDAGDPDSLSVTTHIDLLWNDGEYQNGGRTVYYGEFFPNPKIDSEGNAIPISKSQQSRLASLMMQRMAESMTLAEKIGVVRAKTYAAGNKLSQMKGYRLWPQFGFDGKFGPRRLETLKEAVADGSLKLTESQKSRLASDSLTIQQLIETKDGERWWDENGRGVELTFDFRDKSSLGYKRYEQMKARIDRLKERNKNRSILDWLEDELEFRDDCGRQEGGRFGRGNDCASDDGGGGTATAAKPDDSWWETEGQAQWGSAKLKDAPPVTGGEVLKSLVVKDVGELASAMVDIGHFKSFDDVIAIGGGVRQGGKVIVEGDGDMIRVNSTLPISPDGTNKDGAVEVNVSMFDNGDGLAISYDEMYVDRPEDGSVTPESVKRVSSILLERMTDSLAKAESLGAQYAETMAAGDALSPLKGYRLWPQFGFDGEVGRFHSMGLREFAEEAIANRGEENYDNPPQWAVNILDKLDSREPLMIQELISSREGEQWWDENGKNIPLTFNFSDKSSLGYRRYEKMKSLLSRLKERNKNRNWFDYETEFRAGCDGSDKNDDGTFAKGNDCGGDGGGAGSVQAEVKAGKQRNVDVMIGGQKTVAVIDKEARDRAIADFKANKPEGSTPGSTTDLWDRTFVSRGGKSTNKITESDPVFPPETHRQNGQFVAHETVGQFLANRHEEERQKTGATGPGAIIDTASPDLPEAQLDYLAESLTDDALHAYDVLGVDPGFYSTDLDDTMKKMTSRYPEFETDDDAKFVFTMLLAITSTGQGPDANLRDADDLYRMYREHGTVVPSNYGGGARDVTASLKVLQGLLDSFGKERTRRLLSGYTTAGNVEKTLAKLAGKSQAEEWRQRTGASAWSLPVDRGGDQKQMVSGELRDEVVPVAAIFGPKIGSFFANLSGKHDFLTMDRWLMRSVGRVSGELITRSTPKQAKERAEAILKAIESGKWNRAKLFGVDKTHGITKEQLVRSLKIQAKTGVIEENGAAFIWATAAERSHGKTRRPTGGGYGKHEDPEIHALHQAGNSLFKSLIHEQQDPKTGTARKNIREVFRRVQSEIEARTGRKADIDEIQAALWQYEKRLWKHLGAKTNITDNSLFSAAADGVLSGRLARSKDQPSAKPFTPASRRDAQQGEIDDRDEEFDVNPLDVEQSVWDADFADLDIDVLALIQSLEDDVEERRNFLPLDLIESRSADCGRDQDGKFGSGNKCQEDGGGGSAQPASAANHAPASSTPVISKFYDLASSDKAEHQAIIDAETGEVIHQDRGKAVGESAEVFDAHVEIPLDLLSGGRPFHQVHTHPDSKETYGPSDSDWAMLGWANVMSVTVVGPDGFYQISKPTTGKTATPKQLRDSWESAYSDAVAQMESDGTYSDATVSLILDKVNETLASRLPGFSYSFTPRKGRAQSRSADCGRDESGRFGGGNDCAKDGASGSTSRETPHGKWSIKKEPKEPSSPNRLATTHVVRLTGDDGKVKAYIDVEMGHDGETLYVDYAHVGEPYRGKGVYKELLDSLSNEYTIVSDELHNVATPVKKAYEALGARVNQYGSYELPKKKKNKSEARSADCGRDDDGKFGSGNKCQMGININDKHQDFTVQILSGEKTSETRVTDSLRPYVGKTVGIVRTGKGEATLVGTMKLGEPKVYKTKEEFDADFERHRVGKDSPHYIGPAGKYGYPISEVKKIKPVVLKTKGIVARVVSRDYDEETIEYSLADEQRSADCGRDEDGKFGSGNKCQEEGSGGSSPFDTNSNKAWSPASSGEPFDGASRYSGISTSGGKKVAESIAKMGSTPRDVILAAGAPDRSEVWLRPAHEFSGNEAFAGGESTPVFVNFDADVAGVRRGLSGSSVFGTRKNEETGEQERVLYHNVFEVLPAVQEDATKRHAAARAFYQTMVASVENARKSGIAEIRFSAAGSSGSKGDKAAFRGYTIWPRMGFDAKLPERIVSKLPPDLSHAKSLLDLHATPEGTRWWAENGEDIDVHFDLRDRLSPQSKIMDRFIRKFGAERRDIALGSGDDWLSPADLVRLDEMWQEIWDDGDLDDYEWSDDGNS